MLTIENSKTSSFRDFLRVWWMTAWRLNFVLLILFSDIEDTGNYAVMMGFAIAIAFSFSDYTLRVFPLYNLLEKKSPFMYKRSHTKARTSTRSARTYNPNFTPTASSLVAVPPQAVINYQEKASEKGNITGFEPYALKNIKLERSPWIIGDPGFGLDQSNFDQESIRLGQEGEKNFAKSLQKANLINKFQSFWSVSLPDRNAFVKSSEYETDIDCILFNGRKIYLVDLKNYKSGNVTYSNVGDKLICLDNKTGQQVKVSSSMSRNMEMADELMRKHVIHRGYQVVSRVVLMPTNMGESQTNNLAWPGQIKASNLTTFLKELANEADFDTTKDHSYVSNALAMLVK